MARPWSWTRSKRKRHANELRRVTTWCGNKISRNKRWRRRRKIRKKSKNAKKFVDHFRNNSSAGYRGHREEGAGASDGEGGQAETAFARACECDRPALRLFSAVAKESPAIETRARRGALEGPRSGDGRFGGEPKLRRARAGGVGRENRGQRSSNRLSSKPCFTRARREKFSGRHY